MHLSSVDGLLPCAAPNLEQATLGVLWRGLHALGLQYQGRVCFRQSSLTLVFLLYLNFDCLDEVVSWNIFFDYFVFKLDDREADGGWFYIVHFHQGNISMTKVKDIFNDSSCRSRLSVLILFLRLQSQTYWSKLAPPVPCE